VLSGAARHDALGAIDSAFLMIAGFIVSMALFIWLVRGLIVAAVPPARGTALSFGETISQAFTSRWTLFGGAAIFLYVGAEVAIGSQMALFLHAPDVWGVALQRAGYFVGLYWFGAMIGRFVGSALMVVLPAPRLLAIATAVAALLCFAVLLLGGEVGGYAALSIGLFNSIMFPTIFTLTLERSTASEEVTSGFLCMAIVGGAFVPLLVGAMSDTVGYQHSYAVPALCYILLFGFAVLAQRARVLRGGEETPAALH
jgi:FHS family L-fucose permease-like MFS transporter